MVCERGFRSLRGTFVGAHVELGVSTRETCKFFGRIQTCYRGLLLGNGRLLEA